MRNLWGRFNHKLWIKQQFVKELFSVRKIKRFKHRGGENHFVPPVEQMNNNFSSQTQQI